MFAPTDESAGIDERWWCFLLAALSNSEFDNSPTIILTAKTLRVPRPNIRGQHIERLKAVVLTQT